MSGLGKLKPDVKEKWVAALRSGDYKQGRGYLHLAADGDEFCCLGVLCEIAVKAGVTLVSEFTTNDDAYVYGRTDSSETTPPREVRDWAYEEVPDSYTPSWVVKYEPADGDGSYNETLIMLNDDTNATFEQIADYIEASL